MGPLILKDKILKLEGLSDFRVPVNNGFFLWRISVISVLIFTRDTATSNFYLRSCSVKYVTSLIFKEMLS